MGQHAKEAAQELEGQQTSLNKCSLGSSEGASGNRQIGRWKGRGCGREEGVGKVRVPGEAGPWSRVGGTRGK